MADDIIIISLEGGLLLVLHTMIEVIVYQTNKTNPNPTTPCIGLATIV